MKFPKYISFGSRCCLRLSDVDGDKASYYRHGGEWHLTVRNKNGKLEGKIFANDEYEDIVLEVTEEQWRKCNGQYAPK
tara:strand:- start:41 stop:274 length:234 start_codon:yes stop_codon:yes gene_type:complete